MSIRRAVACSCRGSVSPTNICGTDNDFDRPSGRGLSARYPGTSCQYVYSEVFDLKPTSGLYLKYSVRLSIFLTLRTVASCPNPPRPRRRPLSFVLGRFSGSETPTACFLHSSFFHPSKPPRSPIEDEGRRRGGGFSNRFQAREPSSKAIRPQGT